MPKNTIAPKPNGSRKLTSEEYRVLAEHAKGREAEQRKQARRNGFKRAAGIPANRWATAHNTKVAGKQEAADRREKQQHSTRRPPTGEQFWQRQRQAMIRARNRRRRLPWYPPLASVALGVVGDGAVAVFASASVAPSITASVFAGIPLVAALGFAASRERRFQRRLAHASRQDDTDQAAVVEPDHRTWAPEVAVGAAACSGLVFWIATCGLSMPVVLAVLVGTSIVGARWWTTADNALGPGVPALQPPRPAAATPDPAAEVVDHNAYPALWKRHNGGRNGKAPGSRLTNPRSTMFAEVFDVELKPGEQTPATLRLGIAHLASGLKIQQGKLLVLDDEGQRGEHMAQIKIITKDPVADIRYYTGPTVTATALDGIVHGIGRYGDGEGELDLVMWNSAGMVPTAIIGVTRSGKSSVGNTAVTGMLDTGVMNLCYIDPKGMSSPELEDVARIVILGPENAARAPELLNAILAARREYASRHRVSKFNPTPELPGWGILHDEFSELVNRGYTKEARSWTSLANTIAAAGMWPVAMNQAMHESKWVDDQCRSAFASQFVVMRMRTTSDKLIPGLELPPSSLPNRKGVGVYVYDDARRSNVPVQFDYVPESKEAHLHPGAPLTTTQAFDQFNKQPELLDVDYQAITSVLGPPNADGRWIVGGAFATHQFPAKDGTRTTLATPARSAGGWGAQLAHAATGNTGDADESDGLTSNQRLVFQLIEAAPSKRADIVEACGDRMSDAVIDRALNALVGTGRVERVKQGHYAVVQPGAEEAGTEEADAEEV